jgi:hypothetical protein
MRLRASAPSGPLSFEVPLPSGSDGSTRSVAPLAARARIRELEESPEWINTRGSRQTARKAGGVRREIVDLSTRYGIISRETSYVAIERRETPIVGEVQLRRVPIALTTGWGGSGRRTIDAAVPMLADSFDATALLSLTTAPAQPWPSGGRGSWLSRLRGGPRADGDTPPPGSAVWEEPRYAAPTFDDPIRATMHALIRLQDIDGSWELTPKLAAILGVDVHELRRLVDDAPDIHRVWATALALAWLETHASELEVEWKGLAKKAARWIDNPPSPPPQGKSWMDFARRVAPS